MPVTHSSEGGTPPPTTVEVDGHAIRQARKLRGLEIKELAQMVSVDRSYVSLIETGRRTRVSPSVFAGIVKALDVDRDTLLATTDRLAS